MRYRFALICFSIVLASAAMARAQQPAQRKSPAQQATEKALAPIQDNPKLPRVLLIGDSISIGYALPTRELLAGRANVHRIPANGGDTRAGLARIDQWLGDGRWDVIHFNWGLHDIKRSDAGNQVPLPEYRKNLEQLVERLKRTNARLIWASTTPVPDAIVKPERRNSDVLAYNGAAKKIMQTNHIAIDDLYTEADNMLRGIQIPANVHFTPEGSRFLAQRVADSIGAALELGPPGKASAGVIDGPVRIQASGVK